MEIPLETKRFMIRRFQASDLPRFLDFMLNDESTAFLMFDPQQKTKEGAISLFNTVCEAYESAEPIHSYAIADKETDRYIGSCGYAPYDDGVFECYFSINQDETDKGVATEATSALAQELFKQAEIRAYCHPDNYAAHAVAKKSGFVPMGIQAHQNFGNEGELFIYKGNS